MARHSYSLGVVGNCAFMAHIDSRASVAWMCWPRFDSRFVFGGLLDEEAGGCFAVTPADPEATSRQYYQDNTNVLVTEFEAVDGRFRVIDFAPRFLQYERAFKPLMLMRRIELVEGAPSVVVRCRPAPREGGAVTVLEGSNHLRFEGFEAPLRLTSDVPLTYVRGERVFRLLGDRHLVLSWGPPLEAPLESTVRSFLEKTVRYWRGWVRDCAVPEFAQEAVIRSALALKIHQYEDTGALIAAGTTSLPEAPGSGRTWDYRFCWLRDAYYVLSAFDHLGHFEEMRAFADFIHNIGVDACDRVQPVFGIGGETELVERQLDLRGYRGEGPVRVGNQAYTHVQNDVYGQILCSLLPLYVDARFVGEDRLRSTALVERVLDRIDETMDVPDAGLWELRSKAWKHTYTFLFHWAGALAGARIAHSVGDRALWKRARALRDRAAAQIERAYDPAKNAYGHAIGSDWCDASLLQLVTMGYLRERPERARALVEHVERRLMMAPGYLRRYDHADDFGLPEVAFNVCGFWYIEALATVGRVDDAMAAFDHLMQCRNGHGLLSEDSDPADFSQWGNFPQTYSHVGVINAAFRIARARDLPRYVIDR
ncbi:MAG: glycoside hydrolase family 15 protein [Myxococcales bacterium]|nr:glycoside hydrolase family 15 protein [Myxococcales bacterium]